MNKRWGLRTGRSATYSWARVINTSVALGFKFQYCPRLRGFNYVITLNAFTTGRCKRPAASEKGSVQCKEAGKT